MEERRPLRKCDIVSILVPFTDLSSCKLRPVVILAISAADIVVACITSRVNEMQQLDSAGVLYIPVEPTSENGLRWPSYVQLTKIITLDKYLISGKLGRIGTEVMQQINAKLFDFLKV